MRRIDRSKLSVPVWFMAVTKALADAQGQNKVLLQRQQCNTAGISQWEGLEQCHKTEKKPRAFSRPGLSCSVSVRWNLCNQAKA
jgi:hypothetical protein